MNYDIKCDAPMNPVKGRFPYKWDLNPYRGCSHGCQYCYAMYSHKHFTKNDFFKDIYVKTNIVEQLDKKLSSKTWKKEIINIGGVTDAYQPIEADKKLMPEILDVMIEHENPIVISTKSDLISRDFNQIKKLSKITYVNIAATVTTMNESIRQKIEPISVSSQKRFNVLKKFKETNASIGLHMMPILPYITDSHENMNKIMLNAKEVGVDYILTGLLYLKSDTRIKFLNFIKLNYPLVYQNYLDLYKLGPIDLDYKKQIYSKISKLKTKHGLTSDFNKQIQNKLNLSNKQTKLI